MTPSADLSPPRRPIFFPVVIATVFLTIIGMTGGFVLGERHRRDKQAEGQQEQQGSGSRGQQNGSSPSPSPSGKACPPETSDKSAELGFPADLRQVLMIQTDNGTTVWICRDYAGKLYYQGKTGGVGSVLVQNKNALFLTRVTDEGDGQYQAIADNGNRIEVSREHLEVHFTTGKTESHSVNYAE